MRTLPVLIAVAGVVASALFGAPTASAIVQSPQWTVTAISEPTNLMPAASEVQTIGVSASGGAFALTFAGESTGALPYNATAAAVESALNALGTIGGVGGSVAVTGGPGGPGGVPYRVTFGGSFAGVNVESLTAETASLTVKVGETLSCSAEPKQKKGVSTAISYQWLRDGHAISGAESPTYTTVAGDAGTAIQCLVSIANTAGLPASAATSEAAVVSPAPATSVPVPPATIAEPEPIGEEAEAGTVQRCQAGTWSGSPSFEYLWLKNGLPIPGATEETYEMQSADAPSNIQCEVTGKNADGNVVKISLNKRTYPPLHDNEAPPQAVVTLSLVSITTVTEGGSPGGAYMIDVKNTGGAATDGSTIIVSDVLPSGLAQAAGASGSDLLTGKKLICSGSTCTYTGVIVPDDYMRIVVPVAVTTGTPQTLVNVASVVGGGAPSAVQETPTKISTEQPDFGFAPGSVATALSTFQAGAHPDLTVSLAFNTLANGIVPGGGPKRVVTDLPPGFVGDLADTPKCANTDFAKLEGLFEPQPCSLSTQVGVTALHLSFTQTGYQKPLENVVVPVYNLSTNSGEIARFGFEAAAIGIEGTISLRPGEYGIRTVFESINEQELQVDGTSLTIWGAPSAPQHDMMRGLICANFGICGYSNSTQAFLKPPNGQPSTSPPIPYLTSPTQCTGAPLQARLSTTSWEARQASQESPVGPLIGCNLLEFGPEITAAPDTTHADSPAGFTFDVKMSQPGLISPEVLATADIADTSVALPLGVAVNPGQAAGLGACQLSRDEVEAMNGPPQCPSSSRVGRVQVETPILRKTLEGNVYLLRSNPPDLKLLVAPEDAFDGLYIKLVGDVHLDTTTGQLVTTFERTPQLPFNDFKLSFNGGAQAALATPVRCGTYTTDADFTPWNGGADALTHSVFAVENGPAGSPCASPLPFGPSLTAGSTTDQAGGFTKFSMLLTRADGQQRISSLQFKTPPGLLGVISKVRLCGAAEAARASCPSDSQIGHTTVEAGPGPYPLVVPQAGAPEAPIYLTGPYDHAPYGLLVKVPLVVGPFDLGTEIVRARINVDPLTAQLTVTTDPLPSIIDGIPTDLRAVDAVIDRHEFMFNPTNCSPMSFGGTAMSTEGVGASLASRFQVGTCRTLAFKPSLRASVTGKSSRRNGAGLKVKLTYPRAPWGTQANIRSVKVNLPKELPSRLSTLQKACPETVFEANPADCPAGSRVGQAVARTPVLPAALTGPAYFVSHGGQKFPELVVVLQGEGVTIDLHGETFISRSSITSSTFRQVPDVPVSSFELSLPQGQQSALAANADLCKKSKLKMPTVFVAQNGLTMHRTTSIAVVGCGKHKANGHVLGKRRHKRKK